MLLLGALDAPVSVLDAASVRGCHEDLHELFEIDRAVFIFVQLAERRMGDCIADVALGLCEGLAELTVRDLVRAGRRLLTKPLEQL